MRAVELFGCSGGMAEGFRRAGVVFDLVYDRDPDACDSYAHNLGHDPIRLDVRDLLRMVEAGWSLGPLDLLVADPPCTPWSRAGKRRGLQDERDMLRVTVALIQQLQPRAYLIGNVPGLQDASQWSVVQDVIGGLSRDGYCVVDYAQLNAADYGVPQCRIRSFWFGHRSGPCIRWPTRTHAAPDDIAPTLPGIASLKPWVTCRQALANLPREDIGRPARLRCGGGHPPSHPDAPARTLTAKDRGSGGSAISPWPWDRPATTVCCDERLPPAGHHGGTSYMSDGVKLSERAAAILQGFPDGWQFAGRTKKARWRQIGMTMPPPLAEAVARSVVQQHMAAAMLEVS